MTLALTGVSMLVSTPLGLVWAGLKMSRLPVISPMVEALVNVVRGLPMLVLLFYFYFVFPDIGIRLTSFQASVIGIGFAYSTYMAEVFRSGIEAVDTGQMEAARSIGMNWPKAMTRVVLPQAFRVALPPYSNMLLMMLKDSSIASTIAVSEMMRQGQLVASASFDNTTVYTMVAVMYLAMGLPLIKLTKALERRFGKSRNG